jgi:hypothetical protein
MNPSHSKRQRPARAGRIFALLVGALLSSAGCQVQQIQRGSKVDFTARWALLPVLNNTEVPHAGERVEAIVGTLLRAHGIASLIAYPSVAGETGVAEVDDRSRYEAALTWARREGYAYAVTGSVEEWRYRNGLDGEPAVGLSVQVIAVPTGQVVWSASGARSGWGREILAATAQKLLGSLVSELPH